MERKKKQKDGVIFVKKRASETRKSYKHHLLKIVDKITPENIITTKNIHNFGEKSVMAFPIDFHIHSNKEDYVFDF